MPAPVAQVKAAKAVADAAAVTHPQKENIEELDKKTLHCRFDVAGLFRKNQAGFHA